MKNRRQELILQAVAQGDIATQEQLLDYLRAHGMAATQATVSRDIRQLRLRKMARRGGAVYEVAGEERDDPMSKYRLILHSAITGVDGAGNMVCVRCATGMAQSACVAIDAMPPEGVVGSLAGEDTIFLLCRDEGDMKAVQEELRQYVA